MEKRTLLILAGLGLGAAYVLSRKSTPNPQGPQSPGVTGGEPPPGNGGNTGGYVPPPSNPSVPTVPTAPAAIGGTRVHVTGSYRAALGAFNTTPVEDMTLEPKLRARKMVEDVYLSYYPDSVPPTIAAIDYAVTKLGLGKNKKQTLHRAEDIIPTSSIGDRWWMRVLQDVFTDAHRSTDGMAVARKAGGGVDGINAVTQTPQSWNPLIVEAYGRHIWLPASRIDPMDLGTDDFRDAMKIILGLVKWKGVLHLNNVGNGETALYPDRSLDEYNRLKEEAEAVNAVVGFIGQVGAAAASIVGAGGVVGTLHELWASEVRGQYTEQLKAEYAAYVAQYANQYMSLDFMLNTMERGTGYNVMSAEPYLHGVIPPILNMPMGRLFNYHVNCSELDGFIDGVFYRVSQTGGVQGLAMDYVQNTLYRQARRWRAIDLICCILNPHYQMTTTSIDQPPTFRGDSSLRNIPEHGLYSYRLPNGVDIWGSIFPPGPTCVEIGKEPDVVPTKSVVSSPKTSAMVLGAYTRIIGG
jgi:hypothetical protein